MPTYQYSCTECGHFFEQFQSFSEDSLTVCPQCEGRLRKVFNAVGVVFKGSGSTGPTAGRARPAATARATPPSTSSGSDKGGSEQRRPGQLATSGTRRTSSAQPSSSKASSAA